MKSLDARLDLSAPILPGFHNIHYRYQLVGQELVEDERDFDADADVYNNELVCVFLEDGKFEEFARVLLRYGPLALESVEPHDIFLPAVLTGAKAIVLAHTHPDGNPDPSEYDLDLTRRVAEFGRKIGIKLRYHNIAVRRSSRSRYSIKIYPDSL